MNLSKASTESPEKIAALFMRLSPRYAPTPLLDLPALAERVGVGQLLAKDEGRRALGSFKSLGGTYAGLRALARAVGIDAAELIESHAGRALPPLITASAGNHGLAVAAAAAFVGGIAKIYLYPGVPLERVRRIQAKGAEVIWVDGTYDDAVREARCAARDGEGVLVADTSDDPDDPAVADVMAGYGVLSAEIRRQVDMSAWLRPTHLFVQAGVGGLAAAMTAGLKPWMAVPSTIIVVEPAAAACVSAGLREGRPVRVSGDLATAAGMLACGEASAPALEIMRRAQVQAMTVSEAALADATDELRLIGGLQTSPSGAAGFAGLASLATNSGELPELNLDRSSRVLIVVTETTTKGTSA